MVRHPYSSGLFPYYKLRSVPTEAQDVFAVLTEIRIILQDTRNIVGILKPIFVDMSHLFFIWNQPFLL